MLFETLLWIPQSHANGELAEPRAGDAFYLEPLLIEYLSHFSKLMNFYEEEPDHLI